MRMQRTRAKKKRIVAVSGGFDPVHIGHIRLFESARTLGDTLIVILNNDHWLMKKKGFVFMPQNERKDLLKAFRAVDKVVLTRHTKNPRDMSVSRELMKIRPHVFANGGDRTRKNIPETAVCNGMKCRMVFGVGKGGKVQSSSWLLDNFRELR
jgi:cytidyltransferase-like protein